MPCVRHSSRDRRQQSANIPQSDDVQRSQEVDHIIEQTSTRHRRQRGQRRHRQRENDEDDAVGMIDDDQSPLVSTSHRFFFPPCSVVFVIQPVARQRYREPEQRQQPLYISNFHQCIRSSSLHMSATLSGLIALENGTTLEDSPSTLSFDGQMWLRPENILTGSFRYYNSSNLTFPDVGQYFAWIHVSFSSSPS